MTLTADRPTPAGIAEPHGRPAAGAARRVGRARGLSALRREGPLRRYPRRHDGGRRPGRLRRCARRRQLGSGGVALVLTAIFQRARWKYRERTYRYVLMEAGHIAQNVYLAATSLGLGACAVGAFVDDQLNDLLGIDGDDEAALYIIAVGRI